ncbi:Gfo/Idh/MocA family protein [Erythrobacter sp. HL-111]|uniref:Gfo/Idh/MocA family protein n=1 Tax=Erythrobacter sp. HL-111 TaxID=1798193 RepID=UPI0006DB3D89|nr:Gfo/Idh/MocA family oxidoreductase [Erythrobacter sp. HL-111]KPP95482.1 MAG: scyllo-inositol 2-dehydrogenase (NADP+) IolW [Erythrobacteraceae bacterium HL-111]SDS72671.1 Predicted dehydrogenase [Erythrobacter sp. HL-111]
MTDTLKLAIIGAGRMGITHYSIANAQPGVAIAAVADPSRLITTMLGKYTGVSTYKDFRGVLKGEELDGVLVCTPPAFNPEILEALLERRMPSFVEKPFVLDAAEGARFARAFDKAGIINQVGYVNRWNDMFTKARAFVAEGLIGTPLRFRSEMFSPTIIREVADAGWRASHANGGGAIFEMASHAIDLIAYFFGPPDRVGGTSLSQVHSRQVEDIVSTGLFYDAGPHAGLTGTLYVNWSDPSYRKPTNKFEIFGKRGKIQVDQHGMKIYLPEPSEAHGLKAGWNQLYITDVFSSVDFYVRGIEYTAQLRDFVAAIREGRPVRCGFADAAETLRVIEQIFLDHAAQRSASAAAKRGAAA